MVKQLTESELTVPGLLAEKHRYGYDLEQTIRERGIREYEHYGQN